ncbi:hypothetical protein CC79DRAFT_49281 [Sarocladium strictum]
MSSVPSVLTEHEKEHFLQNGFIHMKGCFTREQAEKITGNVWTRLGMDPNDKSTWHRLRTNMPGHNAFGADELAPRAWEAICELLGGEDKINLKRSKTWRDSLIVNLGSTEFEGKEVNPQDLSNWHCDGDFFVHYLDSPEQALLVIPLFTDIKPGGGGTIICPEAIPKVAKHLHDNPKGVSPLMWPRGHPEFKNEGNREFSLNTAKSCTNFVEATGEVGDVYLLHPLMLHTPSMNPLRQLRIITNPPIAVNEPFEFNRPDGNYSLVERATLRALGKDSLPDWKIAGPREEVIPARVRIQAKMKEEEDARLAAAEAAKGGQARAVVAN